MPKKPRPAESAPASDPAGETPVTAPVVATADPAALVGAIEMPPVSENAIAAIQADAPKPEIPPAPSAPAAPGTKKVDARGVVFKPEKHLPEPFDSKGNWRYKSKENWSKKETPQSVVGGNSSPVSPGIPAADKYDSVSELYCRMFYSAMDMLFRAQGEWQPLDDSEHNSLKTALAAYLRHIQSVDLPPGWALVAAVLIYSLPRFQKQHTFSRIKAITEKLAGFGKKEKFPARDVANVISSEVKPYTNNDGTRTSPTN